MKYFITFIQKIGYGFGFGLGMSFAFKIPIYNNLYKPEHTNPNQPR